MQGTSGHLPAASAQTDGVLASRRPIVRQSPAENKPRSGPVSPAAPAVEIHPARIRAISPHGGYNTAMTGAKRNGSGLRGLSTLCLAAAGGATLALLLAGCQAGYLIDQGFTQLGIVWGAREIDLESAAEESDEVALDAGRREKLRLVHEIREFARDHLGLEPGDAYTTFYEIEGEAVSFAVTAAHPLALIPYRWSFPIVGEVTYKGYFEREDALKESRRLAEEGWDTTVTEVAAFSTLGWFRDPVLSTMLEYAEGDLADLILHELTHRTVYFPDDTSLNESLATVVARNGALKFLEARHGHDSDQASEYLAGLRDRDLQTELFYRFREDLDALYRSELSAPQKLRHKEDLFALFSRFVSQIHPDRPPLRIPASNAIVLARGQYHRHVPLIEKILRKFRGETRQMMAFLKTVQSADDVLGKLEKLAVGGTPIPVGGAAPGSGPGESTSDPVPVPSTGRAPDLPMNSP